MSFKQVFSSLLLVAALSLGAEQEALIQKVTTTIGEYQHLVTDSIGAHAHYEEQGIQLEGRIAEMLPDFSGSGGLRGALARFLDRPLEEIHLLTGGAGEGLSGNPIYTIGERQAPTLAVKVFPTGIGEFRKELWALNAFAHLGLNEFQVPKVHAIGQCTVDGTHYLLLAEDFAQGSLLKGLMQGLIQSEMGSKERLANLQELVAVHRLMGRSLAELHSKSDRQVAKMHPVIESHYRDMAVKAVESLSKKPEQRQIAEQALDTFEHLLENRGERPFGFTHGDAHWGNYLYDQVHQKLWIIDVTDSSESIDRNWMPVGAPMLDVARVVMGFACWEHWGMTEQESQELTTAFLEGYRTIEPSLPSLESDEIRLFKLVNTFHFFYWFDKNQSELPPQAIESLTPFVTLYFNLMQKWCQESIVAK